LNEVVVGGVVVAVVTVTLNVLILLY